MRSATAPTTAVTGEGAGGRGALEKSLTVLVTRRAVLVPTFPELGGVLVSWPDPAEAPLPLLGAGEAVPEPAGEEPFPPVGAGVAGVLLEGCWTGAESTPRPPSTLVSA